MPRVKTGVVRRRRHKKVLKLARGFYSGRRKHFRKAKDVITSYSIHYTKLYEGTCFFVYLDSEAAFGKIPDMPLGCDNFVAFAQKVLDGSGFGR